MEPESTPSCVLAIESRLAEFYASGEPQTTLNFPLSNYTRTTLGIQACDDRELGLYNGKSCVQAGTILLVENAQVSCACNRGHAPYTRNSYADASVTDFATSWTPPSPRIPHKVHEHLVQNLTKAIETFNAAASASERELLIRNLDARTKLGLEKIIPVNPDGDMNTGGSLSHKNRGPWKPAVRARDLDLEKVWNMVANNAMCDKVRSKSREEPSQAETCELWGLWLRPSFINHSCIPNCHRMRVGDAMIIRTARNIKSGEEFTLPYFDIFEPFLYRQSAAEMWGFRCQCGRCKFEHSIGHPYEHIQSHVVYLKRQICTAFTALRTVETSRRVADRLMEQLLQKLQDIQELIISSTRARRKFGKQKKGENQVSSDIDVAGWINASFLDPYIAHYALIETRSSCISSHSFSKFPVPPATAVQRRSVEAMEVWGKICCITTILQIVTKIHPGNLLGQEFYAILLEAVSKISLCDLNENMVPNLHLFTLIYRDGIEFYSKYYGSHGEVALDGIRILMETDA